MRGLLAFACRAFPRDYRARRSGELVDTALLAANGSAWRATREALSLVVAGFRQRLHATEADTSVQDGVAVLAGVFAVVNLAIALFGMSLAVDPEPFDHSVPCCGFFVPNPNAVDLWWIAFAVAAVGIVLGLALARRRLAVGAALVNLGIVGYDAFVLAPHGTGHMNAIAPWGGPDAYPLHQDWLAPAIVLALATAAAPSRRRPVFHAPLALVAAALLVVIARDNWGRGFIFLLWPAGLVLVVAATLGWLAPRLAVVAIGVSVALAPLVVGYLNRPVWEYHSPVVTWVAAPGLALGTVVSLAYLARRRLT
jgi:hypothetical protein